MSSESEVPINCIVVGDLHFKNREQEDGIKVVDNLTKIVEERKPKFVVILGDSLDTHETAKQGPFDLLRLLLDQLSQMVHVYLIVGNHDYINNRQFLSDRHFFNPYKKWENITVVDEPVYVEYGFYSFVFCPYVQPGRFIEALNTLVDKGQMWDLADCIFAHQEFNGCKMGAKISTEGDVWDENYPPVISGHIHDSQVIDNIFYTGSAIQHAFGEGHKKRIWFVNFGHDEPPYFEIEKISLGLKAKKIVSLCVSDINDFDVSQIGKYHIKIFLKGTSEEFKVFRKSKKYTELSKLGIKFSYEKVDDLTGESIGKRKRNEVSFLEILKTVVMKKTEPVKDAYYDIVEPEKIELIFLSESE